MAKKKTKDKGSKKPSAPSKSEKSLLQEHPEVMRNARGYFTHMNGKTIIEDRVPRGDPDPRTVGRPTCQGDLTDDDLRSLAVYASEILDPGITRYDETVAKEDAVRRAIHEKDGGRFAGKVSATTFDVILSNMPKSSAKQEASTQSVNEPGYEWDKLANQTAGEAAASGESTQEGAMSLTDEIKATQEKLAGLQRKKEMEAMKPLALRLASDPEARAEFKEMLKEASCGMKHADDDEDEKEEKAKEEPQEESGAEGEDEGAEKDEKDEKKDENEDDEKMEEEACMTRKATAMIVHGLDKIAGDLEQSSDFELFKIAFEIDKVSDVLSGKKEAATLESDPDEKFMREFFKAGKREGDTDENKYMNEFNTDTTKEVEGAAGKRSKTASYRPYAIISQD